MNTQSRLAVLEQSLADRRAELAGVERITVEEAQAEAALVAAEQSVFGARDLVSLEEAKKAAESARSDYNYEVGQRLRRVETAQGNIVCAEQAIARARDEQQVERLRERADLGRYYRKCSHHAAVLCSETASEHAKERAQAAMDRLWAQLGKARAELAKRGGRLKAVTDGHRRWPVLRIECTTDETRARAALDRFDPAWRSREPRVGGVELAHSMSCFSLLELAFAVPTMTSDECEEWIEAHRHRAASPVHVVDRAEGGVLVWSDGATTGPVETTIRRQPVPSGGFGGEGLVVAVSERERQLSRRDLPRAEPEPEVDLGDLDELDQDEADDQEGETADPFPRAAE